MKWILALIAVLALGAGATGYYSKWRGDREYARKWAPIVMPERMARVLKPLRPADLAARLEETGKVREAASFIEAAQEIKLTQIAPGGYLLPKEASPRDIARAFSQSPSHVKVTFPEGWTGKKMAARLKAQGFKAADEFRQMVYPSGKVSTLEGKLFPDTYYLPKNGDAKQIIAIMTARFDEVMRGLPVAAKKHPRGLNGQKLTPAQVVVLASLVERETGVESERAQIAGVLVARLQKKMRLQCDASIQYARDLAKARGELETGHKARLLLKDLWLQSPFNTYRNAGLPPGAISNPRKESLRAALEPQMSKNLFYVWSPKLQRHRFAPTFAEHLKNKALAAQEAKAGA